MKIVEWRVYDRKTGQDLGSTYAADEETAVRNHALYRVRPLVAKRRVKGEIVGLPSGWRGRR